VKPNKIDRRDAVKALALSPAVLPLAALGAPAASVYSPKFFSPTELELVATLGELILPATDTPGARAAGAHEHIDLVLSEETAEVQRAFREGLAWVEQRSRESHNKNFLGLTVDQKNAILAQMADSKMPGQEYDSRGFFLDLRKRVVFAYYTSEIGLHQELTYKGKQVLGHWDGCPHAGRHGDAE
jgi:gluconate 2-dehydrogenase gamma chain